MPSIEALMRTNLFDVFGERDAGQRRAAIVRTYHADVEFLDPDDAVTGHDALHAKAGKILDEAPGFVFSAAGDILVNHDLGYLAWDFGPQGGPPVVSGVDVALVRDGLIARIYTMLLT